MEDKGVEKRKSIGEPKRCAWKAKRRAGESSTPMTAVVNSDDDVESNSDIDTHLLQSLNAKKKDTEKQLINFDSSNYRQHAEFLPADFQALIKTIADAAEVVDPQKDLLESYMAFFMLYLHCNDQFQEKHLHTYAIFEAGLNLESRQLFQSMKKAASAMTMPDKLDDGRERQAMTIYLKIADKEQRAKSLSVWLLFDFIFRYFGTYEAVAHLFWMDKAAELDLKTQLKKFYENVSSEADLSKYIQLKMREVLTCHTTITGWFQEGDGRRRTFRLIDPRLERYDLCSKYMDHLISAIPMWMEGAMLLGEQIWNISSKLVDGPMETKDNFEKFLLSLSRTTLIGRKIADSRPIGDHLCSYALTSIMGDIYYVLERLSCIQQGKKCQGKMATCSCPSCQTLRTFRDTYVFMGPSPLVLHKTLSNKKKPNGHTTLEALRKIRDLLCDELGCHVNLQVVQQSSCLWRHWLRGMQKSEAIHQNNKYRLMCKNSLQLECTYLADFRQWLSHIDVLDHITQLPITLRCKFYATFKRKATSGKGDVMKALKKMEDELMRAKLLAT